MSPNRIHRASAGLIFAVLLATTAPAYGAAGFGDVGENEFYTEAVAWMVDEGITTGAAPGCFEPGVGTTRGQLATFLHRLVGEPPADEEPFLDVQPWDIFAEPVAWMIDQGITTGITPTSFAPDRFVTRGELAAFLYRLAGEPPVGEQQFLDVQPWDFFADPVAWMVDEGITTGTSATTFDPHRLVTRGEVATFLHRFVGTPHVDVATGGVCSTDADAELLQAEERSWVLLNELRSQQGVHGLVRVTSMDSFARDWSYTMHATGDFEHSGGPYGENIAWTSNGSLTPEAAAERMHQLWVNSPGHFTNMTRQGYTTVGIGFWLDSDGWHATHVFS